MIAHQRGAAERWPEQSSLAARAERPLTIASQAERFPTSEMFAAKGAGEHQQFPAPSWRRAPINALRSPSDGSLRAPPRGGHEWAALERVAPPRARAGARERAHAACSMRHEAGGEDADRRARGLSLPRRAAYTQPERPKGMRERSANSVMLPVLRTGRSLTQWSALLSECYPTGRKWPKVCKCVLCGAVTVTRRTHAARACSASGPGRRYDPARAGRGA